MRIECVNYIRLNDLSTIKLISKQIMRANCRKNLQAKKLKAANKQKQLYCLAVFNRCIYQMQWHYTLDINSLQ